jgi:XTP/dITP diphosphohydrolase
MTILIATSNPTKQTALRDLLSRLHCEPIAPGEAGAAELPILENSPTHLGNAERKAQAYARANGRPAIASDGGLEIPVLGEAWDGRLTRRFAGPSDADRIAALLELLRGVPKERREARFHEAVAIAAPAGQVIASVECAGPWGRLAEMADTRATSGFWIPALWLYPPRWVTVWELTGEERAALRTAWDAVAHALRPAMRCYLNGCAC